MNASITPQLGAFVESLVESGRYQSSSEVVRAAIRLLGEAEEEREAHLDSLRKKIEIGLSQAKRGQLSDGPAFIASLRQGNRSSKKAARRATG
ncbi:MAG: type II toxin-antitoxin system ParD family antitoxin [Phycisphaerales bacterium]|nr:type II toxin-antitoxin system ParD family antitoxin [Phycisphaerales bacterium]